jgi:hypothetical protein
MAFAICFCIIIAVLVTAIAVVFSMDDM